MFLSYFTAKIHYIKISNNLVCDHRVGPTNMGKFEETWIMKEKRYSKKLDPYLHLVFFALKNALFYWFKSQTLDRNYTRSYTLDRNYSHLETTPFLGGFQGKKYAKFNAMIIFLPQLRWTHKFLKSNFLPINGLKCGAKMQS